MSPGTPTADPTASTTAPSNKLWAGRSSGEVSALMDQLNHSIGFDQRLLRQDLRAGMAHAAMLGSQNIIDAADAKAIVAGLQGMLADFEAGCLAVDLSAEDVHTFVEFELTQRIG